MTKFKCQNCARWDFANARPAASRLVVRYHSEDLTEILPLHANLLWSKCSAAAEGFENDDAEDEAKLYGGKMAVFDGSEYHAELWTRFDHLCSEYKVRVSHEKA